MIELCAIDAFYRQHVHWVIELVAFEDGYVIAACVALGDITRNFWLHPGLSVDSKRCSMNTTYLE